MRTINSIKNIIGNFANNLLLNLLRFCSRIIFIKVLSDVYLGVNGLCSNVLGLLALSELGISTAIGYSLYKPLADKNIDKIKALMNFYKKAYRVVALVVLTMGLILVPFLPWFIKDTSGIENLTLIYLIFLANMVIGYLFSYKRTLIGADQKTYKIMPIVMFYNFLMTILQISVLLIFKNYIVYLLMQTLCVILENVTVNHYINKAYPYLKDDMKDTKLDKKELGTIKTNIKALLLHKVGSYVLTSTDNIVISKIIGIVAVGIYSNYVLVVNMIGSFIYVLISNVTASVGNLIAKEAKEKKYKIFKEMDFICYCLYGVSSVCFLTVFTPFIEFCFGAKFLLPMSVTAVIVLNHYLTGMNNVPITFQTAAGLYDKDKFVPLIQSFVNLIISIVLAQKIGLVGVFIGTAISTLLPLIIKPIIAYKYIFDRNVINYFASFLKQLFTIVIGFALSMLCINFINVDSLIVTIAVRLIISLIIPTIVIILAYHNSEAFKDVIYRVKHLLKRRHA